MHYLEYDPNTLERIVSKVDIPSRAALRCCCKFLREEIERTLWETSCKCRWNVLNNPPSGNDSEGWKKLFFESNRWHAPFLKQRTIDLGPPSAVGGITLFEAAALGENLALPADTEVLMVAEGGNLQLHIIGKGGVPGFFSEATNPSLDGVRASDLQEGEGNCKMQHLSGGNFALASSPGGLQVCRSEYENAGISWNSISHFSNRCKSVDLQHHVATGALFWQVIPRPGAEAASSLLVFDDEMRLAGGASEILDSYELAAFSLFPGQHEFVAASHHADVCYTCDRMAVGSLCWHRSQARLAQLCTFDLRSPGAMVQRNSTHHRSIGPCMRTARGHYIFTSHAGNPLCVWDNRNMSGVVWEEEDMYAADLPAYLPLERPARRPLHCAVTMDTDGDTLIGCGHNGMMWMWDLSSTLGWQRHSPTPGSWLSIDMMENQEAQGFRDTAIPLGIWKGSHDSTTDQHDDLWSAQQLSGRTVLLNNGGKNVLYGTMKRPHSKFSDHTAVCCAAFLRDGR